MMKGIHPGQRFELLHFALKECRSRTRAEVLGVVMMYQYGALARFEYILEQHRSCSTDIVMRLM